MTEPKRYTVKTDCYNQTFDSIEDPEGQWIFDPEHKIDLRNLTSQCSGQQIPEPVLLWLCPICKTVKTWDKALVCCR